MIFPILWSLQLKMYKIFFYHLKDYYFSISLSSDKYTHKLVNKKNNKGASFYFFPIHSTMCSEISVHKVTQQLLCNCFLLKKKGAGFPAQCVWRMNHFQEFVTCKIFWSDSPRFLFMGCGEMQSVYRNRQCTIDKIKAAIPGYIEESLFFSRVGCLKTKWNECNAVLMLTKAILNMFHKQCNHVLNLHLYLNQCKR